MLTNMIFLVILLPVKRLGIRRWDGVGVQKRPQGMNIISSKDVPGV